MRISLESLELDGVGPFMRTEKFAFGDSSKAVVFAPNGHGKTATIDLVRWLLLGDKAEDQFNTLAQGKILNLERWGERADGSVTATVLIEGRGRHRIRRRQAASRPESELLVQRWNETTADFEEVPNPELFVMRFFPAERVSFNLLTGEHIEALQNQISGEEVRRSIERLLAIPEIGSAHEVLRELAEELDQQRARETRARQRSQEAEAAVARLRSQVQKRKSERDEANGKIGNLKEKISALDQQIGRLRAGTVSREAYDRLADAVRAKENEAGILREEARERLAQSWRRLAVKAAREPIHRVLKEQDAYDAARSEWEKGQGQLRLFHDILKRDECFCLRPIDAKAKKRLEAEIGKIESAEPVAPTPMGVTPWTLRSWAEDDKYDGLLAGLEKIAKQLETALADKARFDADLKSMEKALDSGSIQEIARLEKERNGLDAKRSDAVAEKDTLLQRIAELERDLQDAERQAGRGKGDADTSTVAELARTYAEAFAAVVSDAIPWYREQLQGRVQTVFRRLSQKDKKAVVEFDEKSCVPRVRLPSDNNRVASHAQLSEGEKMRLGLALLIGLREVASERPFLMLDAPFSELDDEGITSLLEVLGEMDSQVIIFTKNRLKRREFELVEQMKPVVLRMDWASKQGRFVKGFTSVKPDKVESLDAEAHVA